MKHSFFIIIVCLICLSCSTTSHMVELRETIERDSVVTFEPKIVSVVVPGDTIKIKKRKIDIEKVIQKRKVNVDTMRAQGKYSRVEAGVNDGVPYLNLYEENIKFDTLLYIEKINVLEKRLKERSDKEVIIKKVWFWENTWFWISMFLVLIIALIFAIRMILKKIGM